MKRPTAPLTKAEQYAWHREAAMMSGKPIHPTAPLEPSERKPRVKSDIATEAQEQVAFVRWFRLQYPKVKIAAIPNGGTRDQIEAAHLKAQGVVAGFPDLIIPEWRMVIEMKRTKGSVTNEAQMEWKYYFVTIGWTHIFGLGADDARAKVQQFTKEKA